MANCKKVREKCNEDLALLIRLDPNVGREVGREGRGSPATGLGGKASG